MQAPFIPIEYKKEFEPSLIEFLEICLPESSRSLDLQGRHSYYLNIENYFTSFWCMFDNDKIIGTVGIQELNDLSCELKSLYLLEKYHGKGYGRCLLNKAVTYSQKSGYNKMYLDSLSTSKKAIALYRKIGFVDVERYNDSIRSDVFMMLNLKGE